MNFKLIKKSLSIFLTGALLCTGTFSFEIPVKAENIPGEKQIKNIIYMIPDGAGFPAYELTKALKEKGGLTSYYNNSNFTGTKITQNKMYLEDYLLGSVTTRSANNDTTDSAAAGTALATGTKTNNSYVGVNNNYKPVANILEVAQLEGKSTGVISTSYQYDATPSAFSAHAENRTNYGAIIEQMKYSGINLVLGGAINYNSYTGGNKSDGIAREGYTLVESEDDLKNAAKNATKDTKIWGTGFSYAHHFPYDFKYGSNYDGIDDGAKKAPTLAEMTEAAIEILSKNEDGFFLMVEGSKIDYGGHHGNTLEIVSEYLAYDEAFKVALDYAKNRTDTVIVSVADHNTGLDSLVDSSRINSAVNTLQSGNNYTDFDWTNKSGGEYPHTSADVGYFMYLPEGAEKFEGVSQQKVSVDQAKNYKIDNTQIAPYLASLISDTTLEEATNKLYVDVTNMGNYSNDTFKFNEKNASVNVNTDKAVIDNKEVDLDGEVALYINGKVYVPKKLLDLIGKKVDIVDDKDIKGKGTKEEPYLIANKEGFLKFTNNMIAGETYSGKYFKQTENIDMSDVAGYAGIGKKATFSGIYDGQGHTITVNITGSDENGISVFPYTSGTIMNLGTKGSITNNAPTEGGCAGIARSVRANGVIVNCYSTIDLNSTKDAAGIAWTLQQSGTIQNCYYMGKIQTKNNYGLSWNEKGSVKNAYYKMESGSTSLAYEKTAGTESNDFTASTLNSYMDSAVSNVSSVTSKDQLCKFADVEGQDFAFEGSIAKLNKLTYTYTDRSGNKVTKEVEEFNPDVPGYNISIDNSIDSRKPIIISGEALDTNGNETVTQNELTVNEYGFATGEVRVTTKVETSYYTTTETFSYGINITAPIYKEELTVTPTATPVPTEEPTATPVPTEEPTVTPVVTEEPTVTPVVTEEPTVTPVVTEEPTVTPVVTEEPTVTLVVTEEPTATPVVTEEPTVTPVVTEEPTITVTVSPTPTANLTPGISETPTVIPTPTKEPVKGKVAVHFKTTGNNVSLFYQNKSDAQNRNVWQEVSMVSEGKGWFTYIIEDSTRAKVYCVVGNEKTDETTLEEGEWWYADGMWDSMNPDENLLTITPLPTDEPTVTPLPTNEPTATPLPTNEPTATPLPTDEPTVTPLPTDEPTVTPLPTDEPTATPLPTNEPTVTPLPIISPGVIVKPEFTITPIPTVKPGIITPTKKPTATPIVKPSIKPTIAVVSINKVSVSKIKDMEYTGNLIKPAVTVKYNNVLLKEGMDYKLTYKNNKKIGKATVVIEGKGSYQGKKNVTFKIVPKKPVITLAKYKAGKVALKWKKVKGATGYEIYRSTKKNSGYKKIATVNKGSKVTYTDKKNIKEKKTYYYKVRAVKKTYKSSYSKVKKVS